MRRNIAAWQESNTNGPSNLYEFQFGVARAKTQFDDLLGATHSARNQTSTVKDLRDQRVSRTGQMLPLKILNLHAKRKFPGTPYLKAIIVNCYAYCPTCPG